MKAQTILVPIDFSDMTPRVVEVAQELAAAFGSKLFLLSVSEPEPDLVGFEPSPPLMVAPPVILPRDYRAERQRLEELKNTLAAGSREVAALHVQGATVDCILREADEQRAGLIIMGSHGHGAFYELLVGSVTHGVLKSARCPVVVVPARGGERRGNQ